MLMLTYHCSYQYSATQISHSNEAEGSFTLHTYFARLLFTTPPTSQITPPPHHQIPQVCGKIFKYARPTDPSTSLPAAFALVTYSQGICAMRCVNALNNYVLDAVECSALVVKVRQCVL